MVSAVEEVLLVPNFTSSHSKSAPSSPCGIAKLIGHEHPRHRRDIYDGYYREEASWNGLSGCDVFLLKTIKALGSVPNSLK
jgi:hypothetical protein